MGQVEVMQGKLAERQVLTKQLNAQCVSHVLAGQIDGHGGMPAAASPAAR